MVRVGKNERSHSIKLINEINRFVSNKNLVIKSAGGERTIFNSKTIDGIKRKIMFPDILLYSDKAENNIIQGWEIKMPDVPITDSDFIKDAQYKADSLGLESTILWNFNSVVLYIKETDEWKIFKQWNDMGELLIREDVDNKPEISEKFLEKLLIELNEYIHNGTITKHPLNEITENITSTLVNENKNIVADYIEDKARKNRIISSKINIWWKDAQKEFLKDEENSYIAYAKVILLGWINRIIFAHVIKKYHNSALEIESIKYKKDGFTFTHSPEEMNIIFEEITESSDFYTIFESKKFDTLIPDYTWRQLVDFNIFFVDKKPNTELIQDLLEGTVNRSKRLINGQFTTPKKLARLLVRTTATDLDGYFIDPCTATGTIPNQLLELIEEVSTIQDAHDSVWASDKQKFVLQFANLSMTEVESINLLNQVFQYNVFDLETGKVVNFRDPSDGKLVDKEIPKFRTILSNLPFIQFESHDTNEDQLINDLIDKIYKESGVKLSKKSDYYTYIILYLYELLEDRGSVGVITSNSWLGTSAGKNFYEALKNYYAIDKIIISGDGKWFDNADVVACILILTKKDTISPISNMNTNFIRLDKNIHNLEYEEIDEISDAIIAEADSEYLVKSSYSSKEIDNYMNNNLSLNSLFYEVEWFSEVQDFLTPINKIFNVFRGERRGWDKLFYPDQDNNIEHEFLKDLVKNSKEINKYNHTPQSKAFSCLRPFKELEEEGYGGALEWITRFENQTNGTGKPLTEILERKNLRWYQMSPEKSLADFGTGLNPDKRLFWSKFENSAFVNQRVIGLRLLEKYKKVYDKDLLLAILNSLISVNLLEATGFGRGLGALDLNKDNVANLRILNPELLTKEQQENIKNKFEKLGDDIPKSTLDNIKTKERKEFDIYLLNCYGIANYYDDILNSFEKMIKARLSVKN